MAKVRNVFLAWNNLTHDWVRFALFAAGIGFAVVLMGVQLGIMNAMLDGNTRLFRSIDAELVLLNPARPAPSMFDPEHGRAPDIAGRAIADPTATVLSVALLLDPLGFDAEPRRVEDAVAVDLATRGDANRSTVRVGDALAARLG